VKWGIAGVIPPTQSDPPSGARLPSFGRHLRPSLLPTTLKNTLQTRIAYSAAVDDGAPLRTDMAAGRSRSRLTNLKTSAEASPTRAR
jgi:hypothetical protein